MSNTYYAVSPSLVENKEKFDIKDTTEWENWIDELIPVYSSKETALAFGSDVMEVAPHDIVIVDEKTLGVKRKYVLIDVQKRKLDKAENSYQLQTIYKLKQ